MCMLARTCCCGCADPVWLTELCSVFVNGRERPVVMQNMRERIARGDIEAEREEAIQVCAVCRH